MKTILISFVVFIALFCSIIGITMATLPAGHSINPSISLLGPTPFKNFLLPGIILAVVVGGINLVAVISTIRHRDKHYTITLAGGLILTGWIVAQIMLIQAANWIHYMLLVCGLIIISLSLRLKDKTKPKPGVM